MIAEIQACFPSSFGGRSFSAEPEDCRAFAIHRVEPRCVLRPETAERAAEMLRCAADRGLSVVPCGNATKLVIGAAPSRYDVALCLTGLNRITYYEPDDLVVSVEPGMTLGALQRMLVEHGLWVPLDSAGGERATVGGILAANAAGPLRLRYGGPRDMILGMKIATTEGKIIKTGGRVVKNVAGYDLAKLLIGSYGTLGVIVEATFKLHPVVARRTTWAIELESLSAAREFRRRLLASPLRPLRAVLLNTAAQAAMETRSGDPEEPGRPAIWIEAGGSEQVIARYELEISSLARSIHSAAGRVAEAEASRVWDRVSDFVNWLAPEGDAVMGIRAALPIAAAEEFLERAELDAAGEDRGIIGMAQLGVGIVEVAVTSPEHRVPFQVLIARLRQLAANFGGSLVVTGWHAESGTALDVWGPPGDDFEVMRRLKAAWDPKNTLAPGRFVGGL
jgi:glycolate oxidase FAD binding subunit